MTFDDLLAPVSDLAEGDALECWRWLVGDDASPLLLTALGDMFLSKADGSVHFLNTHDGQLQLAAPSYAQWKVALNEEENLNSWFVPELIHDLRQESLYLEPGQCYSTRQHTVLGGQFEPGNFEPSPWRAHVFLLGQIHEQVKDLPEGTPISGIDLKWE